MQLASKQMNIQTKLSSVGGTDSERCLITKALAELPKRLNIKCESKIKEKFCPGESNDKALSAKHAKLDEA